MGHYCFARWRHRLSSSVTLSTGEPIAGARGQSAAAGLGAWAVGRTALHGGPVRIHPVSATPGFKCKTLSRHETDGPKLL